MIFEKGLFVVFLILLLLPIVFEILAQISRGSIFIRTPSTPHTEDSAKTDARNDLTLDRFTNSQNFNFWVAGVPFCGTGCDPLLYNGYGCYCGFLGSGNAVDGIDSCCKAHDWCYDITNCLPLTAYFVSYFWKCDGNKPYCTFNSENTCSQQLCECDTALVNCLRQYPCPTKKLSCPSWRFWK